MLRGERSEVKSIEFSTDGKEVTLNLYANLKDEKEYMVTDGKMSYNFTAHIGQPVSLKILTTQVTAERETPIVYALYDSYGIDVLDAYPGTVEYDYKITNGYLTDQNKIFMKKVGDTGIINLTYTNKDDNKLVFKDTATVVCVAANAAEDTNLTLTTSEKRQITVWLLTKTTVRSHPAVIIMRISVLLMKIRTKSNMMQ